MFPLLAAKGGVVVAFRDTCINDDHNCTNYLTLRDESTNPTTYQLYYHLMHASIPQPLRTIGAQVLQGDYIGNVDNTGYSTGSHLHFHVFASPTYTNFFWGSSVKISFDDVDINDGQPRTCYEASSWPGYGGADCRAGVDEKRSTGDDNWYKSGNTPAHPPSGTFDLPTNRQTITSQAVTVKGTAKDDLEVTQINVRVNYDGTWKTLADKITPNSDGTYEKNIDLCSAGVPDGPFAMTVQIFDRAGSPANGIPVRQLIKNYPCSSTRQPPAQPACTPSADQVALYTEPDFRGACQRFGYDAQLGEKSYTSDQLGALGDNKAASIQVGSNVRATLYDRSGDINLAHLYGRIETFESSDASLSDNRIDSGRVSGLWVEKRSTPPDEPFFNSPVGNRVTAGQNPTSVDSLVLAWEGGDGATSFDLNLTGPGTNLSKNVTDANSLSVGTLAPGNYAFMVMAKNGSGTNSSKQAFTVAAGSLPTTTARIIPYLDSMESGTNNWVASGLWRLGSIDVGGRGPTNAWIFNNNTNYKDAAWRAGDLTSPPIEIPASGKTYLRFAYYANTEDGNPHWDQRRVQVSSDGGPFKDILQLSDDQSVGQVWLNSGPVSLASYAGHTIRLRFHFDTIDEDYNTARGWIIDDVTVNTQGPVTGCTDTNNSADTAQAIILGSSITGVICPEGDVDYYKIDGKAGTPLVIDVDAATLSPASVLDSQIILLSSDKRSPIAQNDDEQSGILQDSLLSYVLQRDGTYYIRVKAWDYPGAGGLKYNYRLTLRQATALQPPKSVKILYPAAKVPTMPFTITASAADYDGGSVAQMDFYWHGPDWNKAWVKLGSDTNGKDGWSFPVDPTAYGDVNGSALYVQAVSRTGGIKGIAKWALVPDLDSPISQLNPLPTQINSTVFQINWTASDLQNDIDHFELQYQEDGSSTWVNWEDPSRPPAQIMPIPGNARFTWFYGKPGSTYRFQLRAVDRAGNREISPSQASTSIGATCSPDNEQFGQSIDTAALLPRGDYSPLFNFCSLAETGSGPGDSDWMAIQAEAGETLLLRFIPAGGGTAFLVNLYKDAGTLLGTWQSSGYEMGVNAKWVPPETGTYFLEVKPIRPELFGTDMRYQVWYGEGFLASLALALQVMANLERSENSFCSVCAATASPRIHYKMNSRQALRGLRMMIFVQPNIILLVNRDAR